MMAEMVKDPVCGMNINAAAAAGSSEYEGVTYYFCAVGCKEAFDAEPSKYVGAAAAPEPMQAMPAAPKAAKRWWEFWK
jgi:Cu+-exporting ATPase